MLSVKEAAARVGVCESIVRGWVASGKLPHYRLGAEGRRGKIAITEEDLDGLIEEMKVGKRAPVVKPRATPPPRLKHINLS